MFWKKYANISLSEPISNFAINANLILLYKKSPEYFNDNIKLSAVSGYFPYSIWSADRKRKFTDSSLVYRIINFYTKQNISIDIVFDNEFITENDLSDTFSNIILSIAHNKANTITLKSDVLSSYIQEKYPLYTIKKIVSFNETDKFNEKNISPDCSFNNTKQIKLFKYKQYTDITLNPICPPDCKFYEIHKKYQMQEQKGFYHVSRFFICPLENDYNFYSLFKNNNFITNKKINEYLNLGFKNFKINSSFIRLKYSKYDAIESYVYYLIKPKYQNEIRKKLILIPFQKKAGRTTNVYD